MDFEKAKKIFEENHYFKNAVKYYAEIFPMDNKNAFSALKLFKVNLGKKAHTRGCVPYKRKVANFPKFN